MSCGETKGADPVRFLTALPVYNEASHLAAVLAAVRAVSPEILVVNDGSTDRTLEQLREFHPDVQVVSHAKNQGYGAALRSAFDYSLQHGYDALVTIDCDGQHEPKLIPEIVAALEADGEDWDIVSGSRYLTRFPGDSEPPADRRRINMIVTRTLNELLGLNLTDTFCGFKSYRVPSLRHFEITELGYAMPLQLWVQAVAAGLKIREFACPLVYLEEERSFGGSLDNAKRRLAYYREVIDRDLAAAELPRLDSLTADPVLTELERWGR